MVYTTDSAAPTPRSDGCSHVTTPPDAEPSCEQPGALTNMTFVESVSVTVKPELNDGPWFVTVSVYVMVPPAKAWAVAVFAIERSASRMTSVVAVAVSLVVLSAGWGSPKAVIVAVFDSSLFAPGTMSASTLTVTWYTTEAPTARSSLWTHVTVPAA